MWQLAPGLLTEVAQSTAQQDITTVDDAVSACENGGKWQRALVFLGAMAMIAGLAAAGGGLCGAPP